VNKLARFIHMFKCPSCGRQGIIDEEQAQGRESIVCWSPECNYEGKLVRSEDERMAGQDASSGEAG